MIRKQFTLEEARIIGDNLYLDWNKYELSQFRLGLNLETERQLKQDSITTEGDPFVTGRLVMRRLGESNEYYTHLARTEQSSKSSFLF